MNSIRRRLLYGLLGMFILGWFVVGVATYIKSRSEIEKLFDSQLERSARVRVMLWTVANKVDDIAEINAYEQMLAQFSGRRGKLLTFQIHKGNQLLYRTPDAPPFQVSNTQGYSTQHLENQDWRIFTVMEPKESLIVQVGEPQAVRNQLVYEITRNSLLPLLLAIPLLGAMIWIGVGRGLRPLKKVADQVAMRSPLRLQRIETQPIPDEIRVFVDELNTLLSRLREAFDMERQFTANAAHEIRTPLAGLRTHAQVALRSTDEKQREEQLQQIIRGVDRITHLVKQLLTLARLDYEASGLVFERIDLVSLAREVLAELAPMALQKGVDVALIEQSRGEVMGSPAGLAILTRNLVDNAVRYTPAGGAVEVEVTPANEGVALLVTDNGPGIPLIDQSRVFERFYRGDVNDSLGCGLGLSIVKRIAELHGCVVTLRTPASGSGLRVEVYFPANPGAASKPVPAGTTG